MVSSTAGPCNRGPGVSRFPLHPSAHHGRRAASPSLPVLAANVRGQKRSHPFVVLLSIMCNCALGRSGCCKKILQTGQPLSIYILQFWRLGSLESLGAFWWPGCAFHTRPHAAEGCGVSLKPLREATGPAREGSALVSRSSLPKLPFPTPLPWGLEVPRMNFFGVETNIQTTANGLNRYYIPSLFI